MASSFDSPRIAHIDVDAMFVAAARLAWPERLRGVEYLLVGGHPEKRGTVASASYACRAKGVHAGMPMRTALARVPEATAAPVPWATVKRKSRQVFDVLHRFAERVERASIDEAYVLLPHGEEPAESVAHHLRATVHEETGMQVSVGISTMRFTAKMATNRAKISRGGNGVYVVAAGAEYDFVGAHPIGAIPGAGPALLERLERRGVSSIESLRRLDLQTLTLWLGLARARFLFDRVRAIDPTPVGEGREARKSISAENTFEHDLHRISDLERELELLVQDVGRTLRRAGLFARTVSVKLRSTDFQDRQRNRTLPQYVTSDPAILRIATGLLYELRERQRGHVRLLGVTLSNLEGPGAVEQMTIPEIVAPVETDDERARFAPSGEG